MALLSVFYLLLLDYKEEFLEILLTFSLIDHILVRAHNTHLCLDGKLTFSVNDVVKSVRHDCNQHVQEHYMCQESTCNEKQLAEVSIWVTIEAI